MKATYDLNTNGCLIITADAVEQDCIKEMVAEHGCSNCVQCESNALESLIANSEFQWIDTSETGDLTDAPMLGIKDKSGKVIARWAYMDYQLRSFLQDLIDTGKATFIS